MLTRAVVAAVLIVATGVLSRGAAGPEQPAPRTPLASTPLEIGGWRGAEAPLDDEVMAQLGVDDHISRTYTAAAGAPIALYVGYYASQRQGDTIHSPRHCLPGAGWQPVFADTATIEGGGRSFPVNRFVIQKGDSRQAVFYWYQGRGRIVANEFAAKGWLMLDAAWRRRSDGGLVRLITPVETTPESAFATLSAFTAALLPELAPHLP